MCLYLSCVSNQHLMLFVLLHVLHSPLLHVDDNWNKHPEYLVISSRSQRLLICNCMYIAFQSIVIICSILGMSLCW